MVEKKTPTLKDIARELGCSVSTVSRALQDHPGLKTETKQRIRVLANKLEYYPDSVARSLQRKSTNSIGVIVPEIRHDFFSSAIDGIEEVAYQADYTIIVSKSNENTDREILNAKSMVSNRVAGIIASVAQTTVEGSHFTSIKKRGIPVVLFDRVLDNLAVSKVVVDDFIGAYNSTKHLLGSGYQRIAHLAGPLNLKIASERLRGYQAALKEADCEFCEELVVPVELDEEYGARGVQELLKRSPRPDAIFAVNDPVAVGAHKEIRSQGFRIPEDIGITGFSNNPIAEMMEPQLTTVDQHGYLMGKQAAQLLLEEIDGNITEPRTVVVKTDLIIRGSSVR